MSKVLIVGGGHAGANTAFALRKDGFDGEITIISDESYLPSVSYTHLRAHET